MKHAAVVLFTGDSRRDSREKNLSAALLAALHDHLASVAWSVPGAELMIASDAAGFFQLESSERTVQVAVDGLSAEVELALRICFDDGYEQVIVLAGDVVGLTPAILASAIEALDHESPRLVLGRSGDGGFYLAGFNRPPDIDWSTVLWRGPTVAAAVSEMSRSAGFEEIPLERIDDIDGPEDALRAAQRLPRRAPLRRLLQLLLIRSVPMPPRIGRRFRPAARGNRNAPLRAPPLSF